MKFGGWKGRTFQLCSRHIPVRGSEICHSSINPRIIEGCSSGSFQLHTCLWIDPELKHVWVSSWGVAGRFSAWAPYRTGSRPFGSTSASTVSPSEPKRSWLLACPGRRRLLRLMLLQEHTKQPFTAHWCKPEWFKKYKSDPSFPHWRDGKCTDVQNRLPSLQKWKS